MAGKKATSRDVARLAGVSQPTVSMILNHYENAHFSEETVQKVMDACERLNYKIPSARKQIRDGGNNRLLVAVCPNLNDHYVRMLKAAESHAGAKGYVMTAMTSGRNPQSEREFADLALSVKAAGVLFLYNPVNRTILTYLAGLLPVVVICDRQETGKISCVSMDSEKMGELIGEHLLELGHRKIAYISPELSDRTLSRKLRLEGIRRAFRNASVSPFNIRVCTPETAGTDESPAMTEYRAGYSLGGGIVDKYPEITALAGMNDIVAIGIMDALLERKYRIPRDYSVCGCDNTAPSRYRAISMTTVEPFSIQRGEEAVNVLIQKIESEDESDPPSLVQVKFAPRLIVRGSTGPSRKNLK